MTLVQEPPAAQKPTMMPLTKESFDFEAAPFTDADDSGRFVFAETRMFYGRDTTPFRVGMTAVPGCIYMPKEHEGTLRLRARVYVGEKAFLESDAMDLNAGTESNADDDRSVHFGIFEKRGTDDMVPNTAWVVGASRLILKREMSDLLPLEHFFPEVFESEIFPDGAPVGSAEASRYIARHPNSNIQHAIALASIRAMVMHALTRSALDVFAIVELPLARYFQTMGLPYTSLAPSKYIRSYNSRNMPLHFNPLAVLQAARHPSNRGTELARFFRDAGDDQGLGYYDKTLINRSSNV